MKASALDEQPKAKSSSGTPPTAPCSITQVTSPCRPFLEQDARHVGRDAEAEIDRAAGLKLLRDAARDDLLDVELRHAEAFERTHDLTRDRRVVERLRRLLLVGIDDDVVDQHAGHADIVRPERAVLGDALDLRNDDAAIVAGGERLVETAEIGAFVLVGEIAALVGGGGADDGDLRARWQENRASPRPRKRSS